MLLRGPQSTASSDWGSPGGSDVKTRPRNDDGNGDSGDPTAAPMHLTFATNQDDSDHATADDATEPTPNRRLNDVKFILTEDIDFESLHDALRRLASMLDDATLAPRLYHIVAYENEDHMTVLASLASHTDATVRALAMHVLGMLVHPTGPLWTTTKLLPGATTTQVLSPDREDLLQTMHSLREDITTLAATALVGESLNCVIQAVLDQLGIGLDGQFDEDSSATVDLSSLLAILWRGATVSVHFAAKITPLFKLLRPGTFDLLSTGNVALVLACLMVCQAWHVDTTGVPAHESPLANMDATFDLMYLLLTDSDDVDDFDGFGLHTTGVYDSVAGLLALLGNAALPALKFVVDALNNGRLLRGLSPTGLVMLLAWLVRHRSRAEAKLLSKPIAAQWLALLQPVYAQRVSAWLNVTKGDYDLLHGIHQGVWSLMTWRALNKDTRSLVVNSDCIKAVLATYRTFGGGGGSYHADALVMWLLQLVENSELATQVACVDGFLLVQDVLGRPSTPATANSTANALDLFYHVLQPSTATRLRSSKVFALLSIHFCDNDADARVRSLACRCLGRCHQFQRPVVLQDPRMLDGLLHSLKHPDASVRCDACGAVSELVQRPGPTSALLPPAMSSLVQCLSDPDATTQASARAAIVRLIGQSTACHAAMFEPRTKAYLLAAMHNARGQSSSSLNALTVLAAVVDGGEQQLTRADAATLRKQFLNPLEDVRVDMSVPQCVRSRAAKLANILRGRSGSN
ncbi:Aste57867_1920 [Aphanomyces stellatus]|uniref:Aste57867_1920 protein n=1 Tax=Aphanomyces stellatus TaxID=120398 RepID=A0A485KBI2_9STRA|nr:hypothetical protein As57867_001918 [Aphanomyces stellatus]VFT79125.1 Aste57867_1920 [Aphanomyces stellatus]